MDFKTYLAEKLMALELILKKHSIQLEFSELGLKIVQEEISEKFKSGEIDISFFIEYQVHFLYYLGEVFIRTHGGEWLISEELMINDKYPNGIKCSNGRKATSFVGFFADLFYEDGSLAISQEFNLGSPYSSLKIQCEDVLPRSGVWVS